PELRAVLSQPRRLALLAYLAVATPRGFHRRDRLLALFWPESDAERGRAALNRAIYFLRRELGEGTIVSRGDDEVAVNPERLWCDAAAFDQALGQGQSREALELYRGDLLPAFFTSNANGFEEWLENERARLRDRASEAAWALAENEEAKGSLPLAAHWARRGVELAPFREVGFRRLLALLDRAGDRAGAAQAYGQFAHQIASELELAPAPETRALIETIRSRELVNGVQEPVPNNGGEPEGTLEARRGAAPLRSTSARRFPRWIPFGAVAAVAATAAFVLAWRGSTRPDLPRVYIEPFDNRTGDAAVDPLGRAAANRIIESLVSTGLVDVVAPNASDALDRQATDAAAQSTVAVADKPTRAGTVVSGEIHRESGRIYVQAWITDARRGRVVWAVRPVSADTDSIDRALDEVRQRVTGAVSALTTPRLASWFPLASSPPTFEALQEFVHGVELQMRGGNGYAAAHLRRAVALDSTFTWAELQLAVAYLNLHEYAAADSIADALNRVREQLLPLQRHWLDWMLTYRRDDPLGAYGAMTAAAELAPQRFLFDVAEWAIYLNRPREAMQVLTRLGPDSPYNYEMEYWSLLTRAYHAWGERRRELAAARQARLRYPERISALALQISVLAAEGRTRAVRSLLDTALAFPRPKVGAPGRVVDMYGEGLWPGRLMITAAAEFRAHGFPAAANEALKRAVDWYTAQPPSDGAGEMHRFELGRALYLARDWAGAEVIFRSLAAADTGNFVYSGFLGTIAARQGDTTTARRILAKFDTLRLTLFRPRRQAGYWQSKISVLLGDEARALTWLSDAIGPQGRGALHLDFDFERMWNSLELRELIRPKG
ncbi:MAG: BTAD domain-containing putative transcriptional regulator, partial [Gemmatimonadaceae bacterium]